MIWKWKKAKEYFLEKFVLNISNYKMIPHRILHGKILNKWHKHKILVSVVTGLKIVSQKNNVINRIEERYCELIYKGLGSKYYRPCKARGKIKGIM